MKVEDPQVGGAGGKESACQCRRLKRLEFDPWRRKMATHSSILAWRIPQTEEPGGLQSTGSDTTERLHFHFLSRLFTQ